METDYPGGCVELLKQITQIRVQAESESTMTQKSSHVPNSGNFHTNVITVIVCVISKDVELANTLKMLLVQ